MRKYMTIVEGDYSPAREQDYLDRTSALKWRTDELARDLLALPLSPSNEAALKQALATITTYLQNQIDHAHGNLAPKPRRR